MIHVKDTILKNIEAKHGKAVRDRMYSFLANVNYGSPAYARDHIDKAEVLCIYMKNEFPEAEELHEICEFLLQVVTFKFSKSLRDRKVILKIMLQVKNNIVIKGHATVNKKALVASIHRVEREFKGTHTAYQIAEYSRIINDVVSGPVRLFRPPVRQGEY